jgi:RNA polymerase sigma-70 factor (ECF subfamily)
MKLYLSDDNLDSFRAGEERGFEYFFTSCFKRLSFFAHRYIPNQDVVEDIISDAFIKIWNKREIFVDEVFLRNYLYKIVRNACLRWLDNQQRYTKHNQLAVLQNEIIQETIEQNIIRTETINHIYQALEHLPPACRTIFKKLYIEGKSVKETATELQLTDSTVKNQKLRGLRILRRQLLPVSR